MSQIAPNFPRISGSYLVLELTNLCNLSCVHCAVSDETALHHFQTGYLDPALATNLVNDLIQNQVQFDTLILFWLGEPLLHPQFAKIYRLFLRASRDFGIFQSIEVHTNAVRLDAVTQRIFLNHVSVPQRIHCTLDAQSAQTYQKIKGRDYLAIAQRNTMAFLQKKAALGIENPQILLQYIVGSNNAAEVSSFRAFWRQKFEENQSEMAEFVGVIPHQKRRSDGLFFRQLDCPTTEMQNFENQVFATTMLEEGLKLPKPPKTEIILENQGVCSGFWKSPVIDWQGNLTMCTRDNELQNSIGSIANESFSKLWWSQKMHQNRSQVSKSCYDNLRQCQDCFIPQSLNHVDISKHEITEYAKFQPNWIDADVETQQT